MHHSVRDHLRSAVVTVKAIMPDVSTCPSSDVAVTDRMWSPGLKGVRSTVKLPFTSPKREEESE